MPRDLDADRLALAPALALLALTEHVEPPLSRDDEQLATTHALLGCFAHVRAGYLARSHTLKGFALTRRVGEVLDAAHITHVVLKGATAAANWSPPEARLQSDVDVLVTPAQLEAASDALSAAGVVARTGARRKHHHHTVLETTDARFRFIDLHEALSSRVVTHVQAEALLSRRVRVNAGTVQPWSLAPEDAAVYLATHAAVHGAARLSWLLDLERLAAKVPLDWENVAANARRWGVSAAVWLSWSLAASLVRARVPTSFLEALQVSPLRAMALRLGWRQAVQASGQRRRVLDAALRSALIPLGELPGRLITRARMSWEIERDLDALGPRER